MDADSRPVSWKPKLHVVNPDNPGLLESVIARFAGKTPLRRFPL